MGTRFTRISVVAQRRQLDLSLPADQPLGEQFPVLMRLLSIPAETVPVRWALSSPESGPLNLNRSLDELGVLDGRVLYLTEAAEAARPPQVDDVESAIAESVEESIPSWDGEVRRAGVIGLLTVVLAVTTWLCWERLDEMTAVLIAAVVAALGFGLGALTRRPAGWWPCVIGTAALMVTGAGIFAGTAGFISVTAMAGVVGLAVTGFVRRSPGVAAAGLVGVVLGGLGSTLSGAGVASGLTSGAVLVLAATLVGFAGPVGLAISGLVTLLIADEQGEGVERAAVARQVARGEQVVTGLVAACAGAAAVAVTVMLIGQQGPATYPEVGWLVPAAGGWGALTFVLRSRRFTRARQVWPMLAVGVVGACAAAISLPGWVRVDSTSALAVTAAFLVLILIVVAALGLGRMGSVTKARFQRLLDAVEPLAVALLIPVVALSYGVIPAVVELVS